jgi:hypothetical protein
MAEHLPCKNAPGSLLTFSLHEALTPHIAPNETYVNAIGESNDTRVRAAYGPDKYERLAKIKRIHDPDNVFRRNANIKPA